MHVCGKAIFSIVLSAATSRIVYELRPATIDDYDFMYQLLVASMKEYVEMTWSWEVEYQQDRFRTKFDPALYESIVVDGQSVGAVSFLRQETEFFLSEIQIMPESQNKGLGTRIIQDLVDRANEVGLPVALQVLKVNPAYRLYERLGFSRIGETETHNQMSRPRLIRQVAAN